jgi:hypothetical protein
MTDATLPAPPEWLSTLKMAHFPDVRLLSGAWEMCATEVAYPLHSASPGTQPGPSPDAPEGGKFAVWYL